MNQRDSILGFALIKMATGGEDLTVRPFSQKSSRLMFKLIVDAI
jgi:hypothetical protein